MSFYKSETSMKTYIPQFKTLANHITLDCTLHHSAGSEGSITYFYHILQVHMDVSTDKQKNDWEF